MAQLAVCVIFHSRPLAQLLSWPGLSPQGCLARESSYCLREKMGRALEGRGLTSDITGRSLERTSRFVDSSCTLLCLKGLTCVRWKDPETEGKPKKKASVNGGRTVGCSAYVIQQY